MKPLIVVNSTETAVIMLMQFYSRNACAVGREGNELNDIEMKFRSGKETTAYCLHSSSPSAL